MKHFYIYNFKQSLFFIQHGAQVLEINTYKGKVYHKFDRNDMTEEIFSLWCNKK